MSTIDLLDKSSGDNHLSSSANQLANQIYSLTIDIWRDVKKNELATGLTTERLSILSILVNFGSKTINELADIEQVSAPAITRIVKGLEKDGYVIKAKSKTDQRVIFVSATRKTKLLLHKIKEQSLCLLKNKLKTFTKADIEVLSALFRVFLSSKGAEPRDR